MTKYRVWLEPFIHPEHDDESFPEGTWVKDHMRSGRIFESDDMDFAQQRCEIMQDMHPDCTYVVKKVRR